MATERAFPEVKVHYGANRKPAGVVCQSSRLYMPSYIFLHDTEGGNIPHSARDLRGLGAFFDRPATRASSTVGVDQDGHSARYVPGFRKAWAQAFYNSAGLSIEQTGFANENWNSEAKRAQLDETARWIALWHHVYGIPIRHGAVTKDGRLIKPGVMQHRELGNLGGGHHDINADYPLTHVLHRARHFARLMAKDTKRLHAIAHSKWERG